MRAHILSFVAERESRRGSWTVRLGGKEKAPKGEAMAGGMDVHKNRYVEEWAAARENLEKTFRFNRRTLTLATIFGIVVPYVTYRGIVAEFVSFVPSRPLPHWTFYFFTLSWIYLQLSVVQEWKSKLKSDSETREFQNSLVLFYRFLLLRGFTFFFLMCNITRVLWSYPTFL